MTLVELCCVMPKRRSRESFAQEQYLKDQRERLALRRESASLLSDAKWRKILKVLATPELGIQQVIVQFYRGLELRLPGPLKAQWFCTPTYADPGVIAPFPYRSIQWLEIPYEGYWDSETRRGSWKQDVEGARLALETAGQFTFEATERGLRLLAHVTKREHV